MKKSKERILLLMAIATISGIIFTTAFFSLRTSLEFFYRPSQLLSEKTMNSISTENVDSYLNLANKSPEAIDQLIRTQYNSATKIRIGGLVVNGSVKKNAMATSFLLTDYEEKKIPVVFYGLLPDLFREGQGVIAVGFLLKEKNGELLFLSRQLLTKHDENYRPQKQ